MATQQPRTEQTQPKPSEPRGAIQREQREQREQNVQIQPGTRESARPFSVMRRLSEDMDRMFEGWGGPFARGFGGPFTTMQRLTEDMDRMFDDFFGGWRAATRLGGAETRWPALDVFERDGKLMIVADVPGLSKDDIQVEVRDDMLCISGERRSESERQEEGYYRFERSRGSFYRAVPLPEGANADSVSASFENGVLKVEVAAPELEKRKGRRIPIGEPPARN